MKRRTNNLIAKWKGTFSKGEVKTAEAENPMKQAESQSNGPVLTLIKKEPVTFQIFRLEDPKNFELMNFVARVCKRTADKPYKTVIHVEQTRTGSRLVASDNLRLHVAEISKRIKGGDYKPHVTKDVITLGEPIEGIKFPIWTKAIPEKLVERGVINLEKSGLGKDRKENEKLSVAFNTFTQQTGETVNICHLGDLTKRKWAIYRQEGRREIVLRQKPGRSGESDKKSPIAVIMPIAEAA